MKQSVSSLGKERISLVSVVIPTYNYGRYVGEAIESVLAQSYPNVEIIVVDDGSTDNTKEVVAKYLQVKYVYQEHVGARTPARAMNNGIRMSRGEYYVCLGADDKIHPDYILHCVNAILKDIRIGFVWTAAQEFGESNRARIPRVLHHRFSVLRGTGGQLGAALMRRKAFEEVGGYDVSLPALEDWDFAIRMCKKGWRGKPILQALYFCRTHKERLTSKAEEKQLHRYLESKYPIMKLYAPCSRIFDALVTFVQRPRMALVRLWNKGVCRYFNYDQIVENPTNVQHQMIDESTILSMLIGNSILDCGCGIGRWGYLLRNNPKIIIGFDITESYLMKAKTVGKYAGLIQADLCHLPFAAKAFDTSLAVEVLEHSSKSGGMSFLGELKRVTRKRIMLTTPENFFLVYHGDNHPETHKSGWARTELEEEGFACFPIDHMLGRWLVCICDL